MLPVPRNSRAGNGRTREIPGGLTTNGAIATSRPRERAVKINSFRSPDRCLHQVDSHSQVRNRQSEALSESSSFHSSLIPMRCSVSSMISIDTAGGSPSGADAPFTFQPRQEGVVTMNRREHRRLPGVDQEPRDAVVMKDRTFRRERLEDTRIQLPGDGQRAAPEGVMEEVVEDLLDEHLPGPELHD